MKSISIICLFLLVFSSAQSQIFYQLGDQWTYRAYQNAPPWLEGPYTFKVAVDRDTVVQGKTAKIVKLGNISNSQIIVRSDSQKVWIWRDNDFRLFVDFSLTAGDTMEYYVPYAQFHYDISCGASPDQNDVYQALIDSVSYLDMNGDSLKQLHTSFIEDTTLNSTWELGIITEGIGSDQGFWGRSLAQCLSGFGGNFACYQDVTRGLYVQDTLSCFPDSTTLPYPAFMLKSGLQWEKTEIGTDPFYHYSHYSIGDPIMIEGQAWNPVCVLNTTPFDSSAHEFFLRQDSSARQLYYRFSLDSAARLLYDFNLSVGSILDPSRYGVPIQPNSWVSAIDTFYFNGQSIRYFEINGGLDGLYEGLGAQKGIFFGIGECLCNSNITTIQLNGQSLFNLPNHPLPQNCNSFLVSNEPNLEEFTSILHEQGQIEIRAASRNAQPLQIQFFNMQGQQLMSSQTSYQQVYRLSTQAFPAGMYLLRISQGQQVINRKILIGK